MLFFFFFSSRRRHTRYWRDWSSDVCSSDLSIPTIARRPDQAMVGMEMMAAKQEGRELFGRGHGTRSEERRVGKECRTRCWRYHQEEKGKKVERRRGRRREHNRVIGRECNSL